MNRPGQQPGAERAKGCLFRAHGGFLILSALIAGVISYFLVGLFRDIANNSDAALPDAVLATLQARWLLPGLFLPALLVGLLLWLSRRGRLPLLLLGTVLLLLAFLWILYCFLMLVAPLYQVQTI